MKIRNIASVMVFLSFFFSECHKDDDVLLDKNGVVVKLPHLWKTSISNTGALSQVVIATPIVYDDEHVLVSGNQNETRNIISINSTDGAINWQWGDLLGLLPNPDYKDPIYIDQKAYYTNNGLFFFNYSTSSYCINLASGQTSWKYKSFRSRTSNNAGIDDTYFSSGANYDPIDNEKIYQGHLTSSEEEQLLLDPEYTLVQNPPVNAQGGLNSMTAFKNDGSTYIAFGIENPYTDFTNEGWGFTELNLYNLTKGSYEYKKIVVNPLHETRVIASLTYEGSKMFFHSSNYVHCHEAKTGNELWRTFLGTSPLLSKMIFADNKLYSACEDRFLYCIDAATGNLLWKEENTGTCSELSYLNGVLYYLGGGDGLLHAVDAQTGKHLWKVSSPDLGINSGAWFYGVCTAVPGKDGNNGVVVATTGLHAYGYEAIK